MPPKAPKKRQRGPSFQQRGLARAIKNYSKTGIKITAGKLLVDNGYSKNTAKAIPGRILSSETLKIALKDEGISLDNADNVVKSILNSPIVYEMVTPDNQLRAADYIAKRLGGFQEDTSSKTLNINIFSPEQAREIAARLLKTPDNAS